MKKDTLALVLAAAIFLAVVSGAVWDLYLRDSGQAEKRIVQTPVTTTIGNVEKEPTTTSGDTYVTSTTQKVKKEEGNKQKNNTKEKQGGQNGQGRQQGNTQLDSSSVYESDTPVSELLQRYAGSPLLGRPTDSSITANVIASPGMEGYIEYGIASGAYTQRTTSLKSSTGEPLEIILNNLAPNTRYYYQVKYKLAGDSDFRTGKNQSFITKRPSGSTFTFVVQADSHMDGHSNADVYRSTLRSEVGDNPDFILDLGDTFMTEKFASTKEQVDRRYIETRAFFDIPGGSYPIFLANGNHEGEFGWLFSSDNKDNDAFWAITARKTYYPNPFPDGFYTGSSIQDLSVGLHENYYAWTWGDALFVVLDPYTYSTEFRKQTGDMWDSTIGDEQYNWLKATLEGSNAKYKFVFIHHMLGEFRGMTNWADLYEWGGNNKNRAWEFNIKRPTWEIPIHQLMVNNNVTILFQGHDHLFCKEEKDGIVYQEVPQPSTLQGDPAPGTEGQYSGQVIPSAGYLRVKVSPDDVSVEYVKTSPPQSTGIAYNYTTK